MVCQVYIIPCCTTSADQMLREKHGTTSKFLYGKLFYFFLRQYINCNLSQLNCVNCAEIFVAYHKYTVANSVIRFTKMY